MSDNTTESEEVLFDLHRVSYPPTRCLCPLFERMLYIYHQLMQTVTWIDSLYRSGPCLPDLNILLSYVGSFYNDFLAGAKKIFNKHQNLFGEERKCCSPASALMTVFEKDRGASKDREYLKAQNKKNCPRNHRCFFFIAENCGEEVGLIIAQSTWNLTNSFSATNAEGHIEVWNGYIDSS